MKKISQIGIISLVLLISATLITCGALMTYYLNVTVNVDSGVILEYSTTGVFGGEEENAEDLDKIFDYTNFVGDDIDVENFYIKCNPNLDKDLSTIFTITDIGIDDPDGLTLALQWDDSGTWTDLFNWSATDGGSTTGTFTFSPADEINFRLWVSGNVYLMEGDHSFLIELEHYTP